MTTTLLRRMQELGGEEPSLRELEDLVRQAVWGKLGLKEDDDNRYSVWIKDIYPTYAVFHNNKMPETDFSVDYEFDEDRNIKLGEPVKVHQVYVPADENITGQEIIEKSGDQWILWSKDKSKKLGTFDSEAAAKKREREIQYFKHAKESAAMALEAPKGWKSSSYHSFFSKTGRNLMRVCISKMSGRVSNPGAFCQHVHVRVTGKGNKPGPNA